MVKMKMIMILAGLTISTLHAAENRSWNRLPGNDELAPATPRVAVFGDNVPENMLDVKTLAPVTPQFATFEEQLGVQDSTDAKFLAPVIPSEADFSDQI